MASIVKIILAPIKILRWLFCWVACSILFALIISTPAEGLSDEQRGAISQSCPTIKQSLRQLQKVDSRTRTYLGTTYETIINKFIVPLNIRLVKNNRPSLPGIQSEFVTTQLRFRDSYTEYMREMENLLAIDCRAQPDEFYQHLETVREKRETLRTTTVRLAELSSDQYKAVKKLRDSL